VKSNLEIPKKRHSPGFLRLVNDARQRVIEIDVNSLAKMLEESSDFYLIDVREEDEYKQGSIMNAIHLSKGIIERDIEKIIPDFQAKIIVYCGGGFRSCLVADNLKKMGYTQIFSLHGGFRAWLKAGYPIAAPK
jgi:rhodanese-related sulfurtransferase